MNKLRPIKFTAEPRERVWGGNYLNTRLEKGFEGEAPIGESWELWSLFGKSSLIGEGFFAGNSLDDFIETYLGDAVGDKVFQYYKGEFPLLIKILDIADRLSVQVHPDDQTAFEREDSFGKAEFWYVMEAGPEARIYMGFNREMTPQELYDRCKNGTLEEVLNVFTPKPGDCIYIEPGCVHAAGGGVVIAEIQQSSDVTYRLYDWGRENNPATARRMDLEEAIDVVNYAKYDKEKFYFEEVTGNKMLVDTSHFIIKSVELKENTRVIPALLGSFIVYICTRGEAHIKMNSGETYPVKRGETLFVPAGMEDFLLCPDTENTHLLEVYMPRLEESDEYLNYDEEEDEAHGSYKDTNEPEHPCSEHCHHHHEHGEEGHPHA